MYRIHGLHLMKLIGKALLIFNAKVITSKVFKLLLGFGPYQAYTK